MIRDATFPLFRCVMQKIKVYRPKFSISVIQQQAVFGVRTVFGPML